LMAFSSTFLGILGPENSIKFGEFRRIILEFFYL